VCFRGEGFTAEIRFRGEAFTAEIVSAVKPSPRKSEAFTAEMKKKKKNYPRFRSDECSMDKKYFSGEGFTAETVSAVKPSPRKPGSFNILRPRKSILHRGNQRFFCCDLYSALKG
jgi:hypothetical protein